VLVESQGVTYGWKWFVGGGCGGRARPFGLMSWVLRVGGNYDQIGQFALRHSTRFVDGDQLLIFLVSLGLEGSDT
jgi:hypothetical protein